MFVFVAACCWEGGILCSYIGEVKSLGTCGKEDPKHPARAFYAACLEYEEEVVPFVLKCDGGSYFDGKDCIKYQTSYKVRSVIPKANFACTPTTDTGSSHLGEI